MKSNRILAGILSTAFILSMSGCTKKPQPKKDAPPWPDTQIAEQIPVLPAFYTIQIDSDDTLMIEGKRVSEEVFQEYLQKCKDMGFTIDHYGTETYYNADNADGYSLSLHYTDRNDELSIHLYKFDEEPDEDITEEETSEPAEEVTVSEDITESIQTEISTETEEFNSGDDISPDFKAAMDAYEEFYDEYIEFMKTYSQSSDVAGMLTDYFKYMEKANEMAEKMDAWDEDDMSDAEFKYYMEVQARVTEKLLSIAQ